MRLLARKLLKSRGICLQVDYEFLKTHGQLLNILIPVRQN